MEHVLTRCFKATVGASLKDVKFIHCSKKSLSFFGVLLLLDTIFDLGFLQQTDCTESFTVNPSVLLFPCCWQTAAAAVSGGCVRLLFLPPPFPDFSALNRMTFSGDAFLRVVTEKLLASSSVR